MIGKIPHRLGWYFARQFLRNLIYTLLILWGLIYLFDVLELLRRASGRVDLPLGQILTLAALKLPDTGQKLFPFGMLIASLYTLFQLNRNQELVVARAAGLSAWQFLAAPLLLAGLVGLLKITSLNPMSVVLLDRYAQLDHRYFSRQSSAIELAATGLWLREVIDNNVHIIHARTINAKDWQLIGVMALQYGMDDRIIRRIDANHAILADGKITFHDVVLNQAGQSAIRLPQFSLATSLSQQRIEDNFADPENVSLWQLPAFIETLEAAGLSSLQLRLHFHSLIAEPLLYVGLMLLGAAFSLRHYRSGNNLLIIMLGFGCGLLLFILNDLAQALARAETLPILLAAWAPAVITLALGSSLILYREDS